MNDNTKPHSPRTSRQKWRYAAREIGILAAATAVGLGASVGMEVMVYRTAAPMLEAAQGLKQALAFTDTAFGFCNIISAYLAIRCARCIRFLIPEPGDEEAAFDAYGAVAFICWGNILVALIGLPWSKLWSVA